MNPAKLCTVISLSFSGYYNWLKLERSVRDSWSSLVIKLDI